MAKRVRKPKKDGRILFQKLGGGSFRMGNRIIKPNQKFYAYPEEVPEAFRDVIVPLEKAVPPKVMSAEFTLKPTKAGLFNVIDGDGKVMNESPLEEEEANKYLSELS